MLAPTWGKRCRAAGWLARWHVALAAKRNVKACWRLNVRGAPQVFDVGPWDQGSP